MAGREDCCVVRLRKQNHLKKSIPAHHGSRSDGGISDGYQQGMQEFSCSGVVIDPLNGLVLTSGQVFADVIDAGKARRIRSRAMRKWTIPETHAYFTDMELMKNIDIDIILPQGEGPPLSFTPLTPTPKTSTPQSSSDHRTTTRRAKLVLLWKCQEFHNVLGVIVPERTGWKFSEESEDDDKDDRKQASGRPSPESRTDSQTGPSGPPQCIEPFGLSSVSKNLPAESFISWFALLKLTGPGDYVSQSGDSLNIIRPSVIQDSLLIKQGDPVSLHATPFAATCPSVFINSVSKGIISNVAGPRHQLIMTDARCMPGSKGGGMYSRNPNNKHQESLAGIIVAPLCWKNSEWIGLTLVCSIEAVLASLRDAIPLTEQATPISAISSCSSDSNQEVRPSVVDQCMRSVVLIKVGAVWGSGVVVNADIILTCRHVVHKAVNDHVRVRIDHPFMHWKEATVIYTTDPSSPFDLAILKLEGGEDEKSQSYRFTGIGTAESYTQGQPVIIIGHALFAPELDLLPSVSAGVMSKVVHVGNNPVMLQSTCAVHAGASGGALCCPVTGRPLGIVTSNARDADLGASFPHINFSVPWSFIFPILNDYLQTDNDVSTLDALSAQDGCLSSIWSLDERGISEIERKPLSKL